MQLVSSISWVHCHENIIDIGFIKIGCLTKCYDHIENKRNISLQVSIVWSCERDCRSQWCFATMHNIELGEPIILSMHGTLWRDLFSGHVLDDTSDAVEGEVQENRVELTRFRGYCEG